MNNRHRNVTAIYEDLLNQTRLWVFAKGLLVALVTGTTAQLLQALIEWLLSWKEIAEAIKAVIEPSSLQSILSEKFVISVVFGVLGLVYYIGKTFRTINLDCGELHERLSDAFQNSFPKSKMLLSEMKNKSFLNDLVLQNKIKTKADPKLLSAFDYGVKILTKIPPPLELDTDYINDIFRPNIRGIYALWTEELSAWLDPSMQFYFSNLGLRSLSEYINRRSAGPLRFVDRYDRAGPLTAGCQGFADENGALLRNLVDKKFPADFHMIRLVILDRGWDTLYKDELAMMLALCELYHYPCLFLQKDKVEAFLSSPQGDSLQLNLSRKLNELQDVIKNGLQDETPGDLSERLAYIDKKLNLSGFIAFADDLNQSKFYIYTSDPDRPFKSIQDAGGVVIELFRLLISIWLQCTDCRWRPGDQYLNDQNMLAI